MPNLMFMNIKLNKQISFGAVLDLMKLH